MPLKTILPIKQRNLKYILQKRSGSINNEFLNEQSIKSVDLNTLSTISQSDILDFLYFTMNIRANSAASRARKLSSLRGFFKYMVQKTHQLEINPCENIELPQNKKRLPKYLTLEQCMELLSNIDSKFASRDYCIVMLFLNCGMRLSELVGINIADAVLSFDETAGFQMQVPQNDMFDGFDLTIDQTEDIKKVETNN